MTRHFRFAVQLALVSLVAFALPLAVGVSPADALMKAHCKPEIGRGPYDPIVHHGLSPRAHDHTFFSNTKLLSLQDPNSASYGDLAGAGTNCQNSDDTAAYWIPTLLSRTTGKPVPVRAMIAYYRSFDHKTKGVAEPIPADLRMVAGNSRATGPQDVGNVNWTCNQNSSRRGPYVSPAQANCAAATGTVYLTAHVEFPSCWDGLKNDHEAAGNTADFSGGGDVVNHLAYTVKGACPAGFPVKLAELRETVSWSYQGDGTDVYLSSDPPGGPYGYTMHADFWNTWIQTGGVFGGMAGMVRDCINQTTGSAKECG